MNNEKNYAENAKWKLIRMRRDAHTAILNHILRWLLSFDNTYIFHSDISDL